MTSPSPMKSPDRDAADELLRGQLLAAHSALYAYHDALGEHWLTGIECDHAAKTDVATCYCSVWRSEPQPNVGTAVSEWIKHVEEQAALKAPFVPSELATLRRRAAEAEDSAAEFHKLTFDWMRKHDKLLGFIQKRPAMLKELIEHDRAEWTKCRVR